jgi:hypothetical protein
MPFSNGTYSSMSRTTMKEKEKVATMIDTIMYAIDRKCSCSFTNCSSLPARSAMPASDS